MPRVVSYLRSINSLTNYFRNSHSKNECHNYFEFLPVVSCCIFNSENIEWNSVNTEQISNKRDSV